MPKLSTYATLSPVPPAAQIPILSGGANRLASAVALVAGAVSTSTATGAQNDFAHGSAAVVRLNNASLLTLTGLAAGVDGQRLTLVSVGAGQVDLANQAAGSAAANRIVNPVAGVMSLAAGSGSAVLIYDATAARWRVLAHEQGAWITPAYSAGSYTAAGGGSWTVDEADVNVFAFWLRGKTLFLRWYLSTTSTSGTVASLSIILPGSLVAAGLTPFVYYRLNGLINAGLVTPGVILSAETALRLYYDPAQTAWPVVAGNIYVGGQIAVEVQ
jgi:hypothetical protein